jgi:hypothetical protein
MTSLTPFLFTSDQELNKTLNAWYVMWINPNSITIDFATNQTQVLTKGGYGWYHWQNVPPRVSFSGVSGWVYKEGHDSLARKALNILTGQDEKLQLEDFVSPQLSNALSGFKGIKQQANDATNAKKVGGLIKDTAYNLQRIEKALETPRTVLKNSARIFTSRLQRIALQPMYFNDTLLGYRRFNPKYIFIYTKKYPEGKKLQGFFPTFRIPETAEDPQFIRYDATFVVEKGLENEELDQSSFRSFLKVVENTAAVVEDISGLFANQTRVASSGLGV